MVRRIIFASFRTITPKGGLRVWRIGVWEQSEGLGPLARELAGGAEVTCAEHPALLVGCSYDLLVVSPRAVGWAGAAALGCETVLLPGSAGPFVRSLRAVRAVSYGLSPRDTLTVSSIEGERICVALQRGLIRLDGSIVEEQEIVLPYAGELPELVLARVGLELLVKGTA